MSGNRTIVLPASLAGTAPAMIKNVFWLMIFAGLLALFSFMLNNLLDRLDANIFNVWGLIFEHEVKAKMAWAIIVTSGLVAIHVVMVMGKIQTIINCFYWAKWVNHIDLDKKTVTETSLSFPLNHSEATIRFDRIVAITVLQSSLENLMGVGRLEFTYLRNENFESVRAGWTIFCLDNPMRWKRLLEPLLVQGGAEQIDLNRRAPRA